MSDEHGIKWVTFYTELNHFMSQQSYNLPLLPFFRILPLHFDIPVLLTLLL